VQKILKKVKLAYCFAAKLKKSVLCIPKVDQLTI